MQKRAALRIFTAQRLQIVLRQARRQRLIDIRLRLRRTRRWIGNDGAYWGTRVSAGARIERWRRSERRSSITTQTANSGAHIEATTRNGTTALHTVTSGSK